ncbi:MAG: YibE/F family protein [Eubacteriales bacterium]|nr:YibE/F family protein [Eubacteriales bacterium]
MQVDTGRGRLGRVLLLVILVLLPVLGGAWAHRASSDGTPTAASQLTFVPAEVTAVLAESLEADTDRGEGRRVGTQQLEVRLTAGAHEGEVLPLVNYLSVLSNVDVQAGDRVIVRLIDRADGSYYVSMFNYDRMPVIGGVAALFCLLLVLLGGKKGVMALLGLVYTLGCIWFWLIPGAIGGQPVIALTVALVVVTTVASLLLLNGWSKKTLCAVLGCVGGVASAGALAALAGHLTPLSGFNMTEAEDLLLHGAEKGLHVGGLLVCGVLIAALGAVMDVAMSIASSAWELRQVDPTIGRRALFTAAMNIGRDAMGTMANTLLLAFTGSSLNLLLLVQVYDIPLLQLLNTDFLCIEFLQGLAGSVGILLTVPLAALVSARLMADRASR